MPINKNKSTIVPFEQKKILITKHYPQEKNTQWETVIFYDNFIKCSTQIPNIMFLNVFLNDMP